MGKPKRWLGLDVGGANLKAAMADSFALEVAFPLWQKPGELPPAIAGVINAAPPHRGLAVTMTGELADCYATKAEGVAAIVDAVEQAAADRPTRYYSQRCAAGEWLSADEARKDWLGVAAANWRILATACQRFFDAKAVVDIGSTTTDVVLLDELRVGEPMTDTQRLLDGRLLYQGAGRTPVCAVVDALPYRDRDCPVAAELFATTSDVAVLLNHLPESESTDTADGRPRTKACSVARLGRMLCADAAEFGADDALAAARRVCAVMEQRIADPIARATRGSTLEPVIVSGSGAWLARAAVLRAGQDRVISLADRIGPDASRCGPAWALAALADEWGRS